MFLINADSIVTQIVTKTEMLIADLSVTVSDGIASCSMCKPTAQSGYKLYTELTSLLKHHWTLYAIVSSFQIMSPMYAHSIDMQSSYNVVSPAGQPNDSPKDNPLFTLQWVTGKIRKCYGCANNICADTSTVPGPPYNIVIRYKEQRYYRDTDTQMLKFIKNEENTYYHLMQKCIKQNISFSTLTS